MKMREFMQMKIIRRYGFENNTTIRFCEICENEKIDIKDIEKIFNKLLTTN